MSDTSTDLNLRDVLARIDRQQAESQKFIAEQRKLMAEAAKLERDRAILPWTVAATLLGAGAALFAAGAPSIGWTQRGLADRLGWDEGTGRRWMRDGGEAPPEVDRWLATLARFHDQHPAPERVRNPSAAQ
jgi:hypothetical protein